MFFFAERLNLKTASEYKYLNHSDCLEIHGVDDAQKFHMLMVSLHIAVFVTSI
jgi:myosin-5